MISTSALRTNLGICFEELRRGCQHHVVRAKARAVGAPADEDVAASLHCIPDLDLKLAHALLDVNLVLLHNFCELSTSVGDVTWRTWSRLAATERRSMPARSASSR